MESDRRFPFKGGGGARLRRRTALRERLRAYAQQRQGKSQEAVLQQHGNLGTRLQSEQLHAERTYEAVTFMPTHFRMLYDRRATNSLASQADAAEKRGEKRLKLFIRLSQIRAYISAVDSRLSRQLYFE